MNIKINKYELIYQNKITKFGFCNTIVFGEVLGNKSVFLIQNMFPSKSEYLQDIYTHRNVKVKVSGDLHMDIVKKAEQVLQLYRKGVNIIFLISKLIEQDLLK